MTRERAPGSTRSQPRGIFNVDVATIGKKSIERQIGKVAVLRARDMQAASTPFTRWPRNYPDVNMELAYQPLWDAADNERRERAVKALRPVSAPQRGPGPTR